MTSSSAPAGHNRPTGQVQSWPGAVAAAWGLTGVLALLLFAVYRLAHVSVDAIQMPAMAWYHWLVLVINVGMMAYAEGFRGFQQAFSPRVVARAAYLRQHWTPVRLMLAPLFCMAFFHATPRRRRVAWAISLMVVSLVLLFRLLPQPWRGVLDAGVVVGLAWGIVSIVVFAVRWLITGQTNGSPDIPVR